MVEVKVDTGKVNIIQSNATIQPGSEVIKRIVQIFAFSPAACHSEFLVARSCSCLCSKLCCIYMGQTSSVYSSSILLLLSMCVFFVYLCILGCTGCVSCVYVGHAYLVCSFLVCVCVCLCVFVYFPLHCIEMKASGADWKCNGDRLIAAVFSFQALSCKMEHQEFGSCVIQFHSKYIKACVNISIHSEMQRSTPTSLNIHFHGCPHQFCLSLLKSSHERPLQK